MICFLDEEIFEPDEDFIRRTTMVHIEDRLRRQMSHDAANDLLCQLPKTIFPEIQSPYKREVLDELSKYDEDAQTHKWKACYDTMTSEQQSAFNVLPKLYNVQLSKAKQVHNNLF